MHRLWDLSILLTLLSSLVTALEPSKRIDVHAWPLSDQRSQMLASIEYNSTSAVIRSSHAPKIPSDERVVRVGFYQAESNTWSGIVTAADNFAPTKDRTILLNLDAEAMAYHVGFKAIESSGMAKGVLQAEIHAEVVPLHTTPEVYLNKPILLDATGKLEQPQEKTFLQKYWWAIAGFLLLQVLLGGGSSDKKE